MRAPLKTALASWAPSINIIIIIIIITNFRSYLISRIFKSRISQVLNFAIRKIFREKAY